MLIFLYCYIGRDYLKKYKTKEDLKLSDVIDEVKKIAFHNLSDVVILESEELELKDFDFEDKAIKSVEFTNGKLKLQFYDKLRALDLLSKILEKDTAEIAKDEEEESVIVNFKNISDYT